MRLLCVNIPKASEARIRANTKYNRKVFETIQVRVRKAERIGMLIAIGATRASVSKATYILDAIKAKLSADGITTADIDQEEQTKD